MDQRIISNIPEEYHVAEDIPVTEPERQAFFLERIHTYVEQNRAEGRSLRYAIVTFPGGGRELELEKKGALTLTATAQGVSVDGGDAGTESEAWERFCER